MTPVYRVVSWNGRTLAEYIDTPSGGGRIRALRHATDIEGKVFHVDEHGFLALICDFTG